MAYLVLVIDSPDSIAQLNSKISADATCQHQGVEQLKQYLEEILAGTRDCSVQSTSRDTDPSVATSGSGSTQKTYNLK